MANTNTTRSTTPSTIGHGSLESPLSEAVVVALAVVVVVASDAVVALIVVAAVVVAVVVAFDVVDLIVVKPSEVLSESVASSVENCFNDSPGQSVD